MAEQKKKKRRNLYDLLNRGNDKKGVEKKDEDLTGISGFFKLFGRRFGVMIELNIMFLLANFPIFFVLFALSGYSGHTTTAPSSALFANILPLIKSGNANPVLSALYGIHGIQGTMMVSTTLTYVFYALGLLLVFTIGLSTLGITYNMRNIAKGEPLFILSDFFEIIKKNFLKGIIMGVLDVAIIGILLFDISIYSGYMKYIAVGIVIIYLLMRFYIYIMIPTFKMSLFKIFKNALIFIVLNIKRNLVAIVGIVIVLAVNYVAFLVYFPIGILLPVAISISAIMFIGTYAAWPSVKEVMIDPYEEEEDDTEKEEPIFKDRG